MLFIVGEDYLLPPLITERELSYKAASSAACLTSHSPAGTTTHLTEQKFKDNALLLIAPFKQNSPKRTKPLSEGETEAQVGWRAFLLALRAAGDLQLLLSPSCWGELLPALWHLQLSFYLWKVNKLAPLLICHKTCKIYVLRFP